MHLLSILIGPESVSKRAALSIGADSVHCAEIAIIAVIVWVSRCLGLRLTSAIARMVFLFLARCALALLGLSIYSAIMLPARLHFR